MADLPIPTSADAGSVLRVNDAGDGYVICPNIKYVPDYIDAQGYHRGPVLLVDKPILSAFDAGIGDVFAANPKPLAALNGLVNNRPLIAQKDQYGVLQNLISLGHDQNDTLGPSWDPRRSWL